MSRLRPIHRQMRDEAGHEHEVEGAMAGDLVRDGHVGASRIADGGPCPWGWGIGLVLAARRRLWLRGCGLRQLEQRILAEDPPLHLPKRRRRLQAELFVEGSSRRLERCERIRLASAAVERQHELSSQALSERVSNDQRLELSDDGGMPSEREVGVDPLLGQRKLKLLDPCRLRDGEWLLELGEGRTAPERERAAQRGRGRIGVARLEGCSPLREHLLGPVQIHLMGRDVECIARRPRDQDLIGHRLSQLRHVDLDHLDGRLGNALAPQVVDEPAAGDGATRIEDQHGQQGALLPTSESERRASHLQRPENSVFHLPEPE